MRLHIDVLTIETFVLLASSLYQKVYEGETFYLQVDKNVTHLVHEFVSNSSDRLIAKRLCLNEFQISHSNGFVGLSLVRDLRYRYFTVTFWHSKKEAFLCGQVRIVDGQDICVRCLHSWVELDAFDHVAIESTVTKVLNLETMSTCCALKRLK